MEWKPREMELAREAGFMRGRALHIKSKTGFKYKDAREPLK